jgi:hypothetical protein
MSYIDECIDCPPDPPSCRQMKFANGDRLHVTQCVPSIDTDQETTGVSLQPGKLNPNRPYPRVFYSNYFAFLGRPGGAIREAKEAVERDPASILMNRKLAFVYLLSHKNSEYAAQAQATLELAPNDGLAKWDLPWASVPVRTLQDPSGLISQYVIVQKRTYVRSNSAALKPPTTLSGQRYAAAWML